MVGNSRNNNRLKETTNLVSLRGGRVGCTTEHQPSNVGEGLTFRNLIIPRVVKATRNFDTKTGRSDHFQGQSSARSMSIKSDATKTRKLITVKKRLMPKDILTDAKSNSSEIHELMSDRSNTSRHSQREKRVNYHH